MMSISLFMWVFEYIQVSVVIITIVGSVYNITKNDAEWTSTAFIIYNGDIYMNSIFSL